MQRPIHNDRERGATIVEAAIVMVVFFTFVFGIFEAGRFLNVQQVLTNAAREGARFGVSPLSGSDTLPTTEEIESVVAGFLAPARIQGATITVDPAVTADTGAATTTFTRVTVATPYRPLTGLFPMLGFTVTRQALMRNETSD